jgi:hypothetical protein
VPSPCAIEEEANNKKTLKARSVLVIRFNFFMPEVLRIIDYQTRKQENCYNEM